MDAQLLVDHQFWVANHSSIGSEDHCRCGFRPQGWAAWAEHVAAVAKADTAARREARRKAWDEYMATHDPVDRARLGLD